MDKRKKQILEGYLYTIKGLADLGYQRRTWVRGEAPYCSDYGETSCFYSDGEEIIEKYQDYEIIPCQKDKLRILSDTLEHFSDTEDDFLEEEFIDGPAWAKVVEKANDVLEAFGRPRRDRVGKEYFTKEINDKITGELIKKLTCIPEIAIQPQKWVCQVGEVDRYREVIYDFYDSAFFVLDRYKDLGLTEAQKDLLEKFKDKLIAFESGRDKEKEFYEDPRWGKIVASANDVLEAFGQERRDQ